MAPAFTVSAPIKLTPEARTITGTCGASGLLSGRATPVSVGETVASDVGVFGALGPIRPPLIAVPTGIAPVVASLMIAPRASRARDAYGMESTTESVTRCGSIRMRRAT